MAIFNSHLIKNSYMTINLSKKVACNIKNMYYIYVLDLIYVYFSIGGKYGKKVH